MNLKHRQIETFSGWLFILPSVLGFGLLTVLPILFSLVISFTEWNFLKGLDGFRFVGLDNFAKMWSDRWFTDSLRNNAVFTAVTVPLTMALSLFTAIGLNSGSFLKKPIRLMVFMPYISSIVAISIVWGVLYNPSQGPINAFLHGIGIADPPKWLASSAWALPSIMIMSIWSNIGYNMVIYLAGLQNIPKDLYEAAKIDGAGPVACFANVTLPLLSPTSFFVLITCMIHSFQVFGAVFIMTQGGPGSSTSVLTYYIYQVGFSFYDMGYASAMAWFLFLLILLVTAVQWRGQKRWVNY
ncbi:carbohydrate ABC transporter permease [Paenibacillus thalictri]|uniref:Sugar ABC transporter permease n=1 Tax=Paenibacillus thalictri TaxID=2527873 RepID=A0A4Q9DG01_9BACL|nr:sugar ABC transporter permease [Paenibacillus thalictri]TBL71085.1 sugar ABC transporter permease [Paenibacillus thalictri]